MIAPGLGRQGSIEKEWRSYSYARLNKTFMVDKEQARAGDHL